MKRFSVIAAALFFATGAVAGDGKLVEACKVAASLSFPLERIVEADQLYRDVSVKIADGNDTVLVRCRFLDLDASTPELVGLIADFGDVQDEAPATLLEKSRQAIWDHFNP